MQLCQVLVFRVTITVQTSKQQTSRLDTVVSILHLSMWLSLAAVITDQIMGKGQKIAVICSVKRRLAVKRHSEEGRSHRSCTRC